MHTFLDQLYSTIVRSSLIQENEKVLIGVSGGPDSIVLLHSLQVLSEQYQLNWQLFALHVNHLLRGRESDRDAQYVASFCEQQNIPYMIREVNVRARLEKEGGNQQAVARQLRYEAFYQEAQKRGIAKIALGHHADDQIETVLMRLIRGTGVSGLAGMQVIRDWRGMKMIRPLLPLFRQQIEGYLQLQENITPCTDSSNDSMVYTRNRIRAELIPALESYNQQVKSSLLQLTDLVREEEKVWAELTQQALSTILLEKNEMNYRIDVKKFLDLPVALQRRTVKLILDCLLTKASNEITLDMVDQVRRYAVHKHPAAEAHITGGILIKRQYEQLHFTYRFVQQTAKNKPIITRLIIPGITQLSSFGGEIETYWADQQVDQLKLDHQQVAFDAEVIDQPLFVRSRQAGDRMTCFGLNGTKKVKDLLMECKVPRNQRDRCPIVVMGNQILWIPGIRRSNVAPITNKTKRILYLIWHPQKR